jgi:hypothetical protein
MTVIRLSNISLTGITLLLNRMFEITKLALPVASGEGFTAM